MLTRKQFIPRSTVIWTKHATTASKNVIKDKGAVGFHEQVQLPIGSPAACDEYAPLSFHLQSVPNSIWDAAEINRSAPVVDPNTETSPVEGACITFTIDVVANGTSF
ncbi:hypothetical protein BST61_g7338 [Cercospora zeina]